MKNMKKLPDKNEEIYSKYIQNIFTLFTLSANVVCMGQYHRCSQIGYDST